MRYLKYAKWLLLTVLLWFSLAVLYLTLPSADVIDNDVEFARQLRDGSPLLRVYRTENFIPREFRLPRVRRRLYSALRYTYDPYTSTVRIRNEEVSLASLLAPPSSSSETPRSRLIAPWAKLGDTDGVTPPWFPVGDAALLYGFMSREWGRLLLTVERVPPEEETSGEVVLRVVPARSASQTEGNQEDAIPLGMPELVSFHFSVTQDHDRSTVLDMADLTLSRVSFPPQPRSYPPSKFFFVRRFLLSILAPSAMLFMTVAGLVGELFKLSLILLGVVALLWIARELWMYRHDVEVAAADTEEGRSRQAAALRKALREILGPVYAERESSRYRAPVREEHEDVEEDVKAVEESLA